MIIDNTLKQLLAPSGHLQAQPATDWTGDMPLPQVLADFYANIGPMGETYHANIGPVGLTFNVGGNPVCVPPLAKLWKLQAGYRWHGLTGERLADWQDHWLVIAEQGGDPFILDTLSNEILFAFHGANSWIPQLIAPNLATAIGAIATVANTLDALGDDAYDDDGCELASASRLAVTNALASYFNDESTAHMFLSTWQWYE
ncbi:MAG: hypothetical protein WBP13_04710 [Methylophilaceae bacterium]